ncbi:PAQR family membrane homeostasis protein TrhA, partial [Pseudomonas aeruginosa]
YLASAIYHALPDNRAKRLFNVLDHSAIYLLIAGTYTPFALGALRGPWGWTLFGLVWGMALLGVGLKAS